MESQSYKTIQMKATELYCPVVRHYAVQGGSKLESWMESQNYMTIQVNGIPKL